MTTDHLTTPQRRILEAIRAAGGPVGIHQVERITGTSKSWTTTAVRRFHQAGLIHVADWRHTGNNAWPRYRYGAGIDAPRPKVGREELLRRKRERQRLQKAEQRCAERAARLPPALPTHTPSFGFWGI